MCLCVRSPRVAGRRFVCLNRPQTQKVSRRLELLSLLSLNRGLRFDSLQPSMKIRANSEETLEAISNRDLTRSAERRTSREAFGFDRAVRVLNRSPRQVRAQSARGRCCARAHSARGKRASNVEITHGNPACRCSVINDSKRNFKLPLLPVGGGADDPLRIPDRARRVASRCVGGMRAERKVSDFGFRRQK